MNFTIGSDKKSGRDREIESGRMGDDYEIGAGGAVRELRRFGCVSSNHSCDSQLINQQWHCVTD